LYDYIFVFLQVPERLAGDEGLTSQHIQAFVDKNSHRKFDLNLRCQEGDDFKAFTNLASVCSSTFQLLTHGCQAVQFEGGKKGESFRSRMKVNGKLRLLYSS